MSLPSTPPAALMSFCASFIVAFAGAKYAMEPVSGRSPAAVNVASSVSALLSAPEPQPDSVSIAAAGHCRRRDHP